jgi:hypothetical protein
MLGFKELPRSVRRVVRYIYQIDISLEELEAIQYYISNALNRKKAEIEKSKKLQVK